MIFVDHAILHLIWFNRYQVSERLWRSCQPTPYQIRWAMNRGRLRTVVNLRGGREYGSWPLEVEACERLGLAFETVTTRSREAPSKETLRELHALFQRMETPALVHCKSGADRAGFVSALWLVVMEGADVDTALKQLSWWYGHVRAAKTGILDAFFEKWRDDTRDAPMPLMEWVETRYDPEQLTRDFHDGWWADVLVDRILHRE